MKHATLMPLVLLAGCDRQPADAPSGPGAQIERSAIAAGQIADPIRAPLVGSWAHESDRLCVVPRHDGHDRIGLAVDYGDGQACVTRGSVDRRGDRLDLTLGDCRLAARFDGDRIVLPPEVPVACDRLCTGRASLAALAVDRQSDSAADATAVVAPDGGALCPGS